ncbi:putative endopeptidase [Luteimonas cucumeris]|uniref:Putative endopeptidase n=1 Tax=Luteimonas cucumeris TaxID=985012 RepID=A0A562LBT0_9GAMM|nr:M13 family metallopeptidase [Luteimonas cucumeris]TWI04995.1 putative endopeptidase [Luteimonas cucumeris]
MPNARPLALALIVALAASVSAPDADAAKKKKAAPKKAAAATACSDFYGFSNADWFKANPLPADVASVSALGQMRERSVQQQRDLLDGAMRAPQGNVQKLLGDFWASGLDEAAVEADGSNSIAPLLARINGIRKAKDIAPSLAALHQVGIPVLFNFSPDVDLAKLDRHIGYFGQGGLGLSDPEFYTRSDANTKALMERYRDYVKSILTLTGTPKEQLDAQVQSVIDLETRIAQASRPLTALRDPRANYAPVPASGLKQYKRLQLREFLEAQGVKDDTVSMANPQLFAQLDALVGSLPPAQWQAYLRYHVGNAMAPYLSKPFRDADFAFRGQLLRGETTPAPRWRQVLDAINTAAGPMLGREYAARYLPAATDARAEEIAKQVRATLERQVAESTWLSAEAKAAAKARLDNLKIEIGTPNRDLDYTVQPMGRGSFGSNMLIASTWRHREEMKRIGHGNADRRWDVLPQHPALAYDIAQNRLIATAATLQAPVLDMSRDAATHYGTYGALVAHELSHAVDNKGRMIDVDGTIKSWWTPADEAAWQERAGKLALQYDGYAYPGLTGVKVDGRQTSEENAADLAGIELAYDAFSTDPSAASESAKQAFFKAWAQLWAQQNSADAAKVLVATEVHAPGQWRANGPLVNQPAFGEAYQCKATTNMQKKPEEQVSFWR